MNVERLQAQGEVELAEKLLADPDVIKAIEVAEEHAKKGGARRHLLATAMRLTPEMAPDIASIMEETSKALSLEAPIETYVYPSPQFNAAAVRPEAGRLFVMFSSALLEGFEPDELRFVVGHELGHHLFRHHDIPTQLLLHPSQKIRPGLALQIFAWQRYAEVSCDRAGVVAAGGLRPATTALFKLASGLASDRVRVQVDHFVAQLGDLRDEVNRLDRADAPARSDWFATHPFSPLRLRAAELFSKSMLCGGDVARDQLEAQVHELMTLMDPSYLQSKTAIAEAMRRLLFAAGIEVAAAGGTIGESEIGALEELLGPGSIPTEINVEAIRETLPKRVEAVKKLVPPLRRVQVIRDLCLVAGADGAVSEAEHRVIEDVSRAVEVDSCHIETFLDEQTGRELDLILDGLIASVAVIGVAMVVLWGISVAIRDVSIVDIFWGLGFVAVAWTVFILSGARGPRAYALLIITSMWGVRLAAYLSWRNWGKGEDFRYQDMRRQRGESFWWKSAYIVFAFQGALIILVSLPLLVGIGLYGDRDLTTVGLVGVGLCAVGLFFEWVGDWQLLRFKADPDNRGKVMDRGLWALTRHPNYFGDFCVWWGLAAISSPAPERGWVIIGPVIMSLMLLKVSGVGLLEKSLSVRPGYAEYAAKTSAFFPWLPKKLAKAETED